MTAKYLFGAPVQNANEIQGHAEEHDSRWFAPMPGIGFMVLDIGGLLMTIIGILVEDWVVADPIIVVARNNMPPEVVLEMRLKLG